MLKSYRADAGCTMATMVNMQKDTSVDRFWIKHRLQRYLEENPGKYSNEIQ